MNISVLGIDLGKNSCSDVVTPSLITTKAGDRMTTSRRDATMLARLHRAGELTPVWVPDADHEGMRDLMGLRSVVQGGRKPNS
jgi:transposase